MSESGSVAGAPHAWGWWVLEKLACVEPPLERRQSERTSVLIRDATEVLSWGGIPFSAVERKRWMPVLSDYVNVFGEAEAVLRDKGYQVWYVEAAKLFFAGSGAAC